MYLSTPGPLLAFGGIEAVMHMGSVDLSSNSSGENSSFSHQTSSTFTVQIPTPGIPHETNPEIHHVQWLPPPPNQPNRQQEPLSGSNLSQGTNRTQQNRRSTTHNTAKVPAVQTSSPSVLRLENASEPISSPGDPAAQAANRYDLTQHVITAPKDIERWAYCH